MFKFYPKLLYKIDDHDYLKVSDINFYSKIRDYVRSFGLTNGRPYIITNGDSPSIVSYKVYGTTKFEYGILILNDIRNVYDEWPKNSVSFKEYLESKYGNLTFAESNFIFYYRSDKKRVSRDTWLSLVDPNKYAETYYDYETRLNEEKSKIKLLDYSLMISFEVELRQLTSKLLSAELNRVTK